MDVKLVLRRQNDVSHVRGKEASGTKPRRYAVVASKTKDCVYVYKYFKAC